MTGELRGLAAVVTGAARGIGAATAIELSAQGAAVALVDREGEAARSLAARLEADGGRALALEADVSDLAAAVEIVHGAKERFGRLDILVANAGVTRDRVVWKMSPAEWSEVLSTNLGGVFAYVRAVAPIFREAGSGRIVAISSINAERGKFGQSNYCAAKAGVHGLVRAVARELGPRGVTVNAVAPGFVDTAMTSTLPPEARRRALEETLLGRVAAPEDVAWLVAFLCGERARHVTGQVIRIDGGQSL